MAEPALDEEKLGTLGRWAAGLRTDERPEVAAAGRAIEMLVEEIERLHVLLWDMRLNPPEAPLHQGESPAALTTDGQLAHDEPALERTLRERLTVRRRGTGNPHP